MDKHKSERCRKVAWKYYEAKQAVNAAEEVVAKIRPSFDDAMDDMFCTTGAKKSITLDALDVTSHQRLVVRKVERTQIIWDVAKLEKHVPPELVKQIVKKQYYVDNMPGLIAYLKHCGVDPRIFKQYIRAEKSVDQKAVDRLGDLGQLTVKHISGCYNVQCSKPYYTVTLKDDADDYSRE